MNASCSNTPAFRQASTMVCACTALTASGFSHSTCLPACAARMVHSGCRLLGRGLYGIDVPIGQQPLIRAVGPRDLELGGDFPGAGEIAAGDRDGGSGLAAHQGG